MTAFDSTAQLAFKHAWQIAGKARALPADERDAFVRKACGENVTLRRDVEVLVRDAEPGFLRTGAALLQAGRALAETADGWIDGPVSGATIGDYHLLQELGVGGMSRVYLARRDGVEFEQHVAVKIMRSFGRASDHARRRFEREQQVLASLSHPNIASIIDGGVTPSGRPFLVMEFVDGKPITEYCVDNKLGLDERLALFVEVCAAVEHAHRALVVHRDLKPSNVYVDAQGRVKLLDFGIAKLLDADDSAAMTRTGMMMMTPQYATPEQVTGGVITTATDIYTLGLILYELLTGARPWESEDQSVTEQLRQICDQNPERPSTVVARADSVISDARRWSSRLRGDLDLVVGKALAKDPRERYGSCADLMRDIEHWRQGKPVAAHAPGVVYRAQKFARRHWLGLAATSAVIGLVSFFLVALIHQQQATRFERDRAQQAQAATGAINRFLVDELLGATATTRGSGRDVPVSAVLGRAANTAERAFAGQPLLEAAIRDTLGQTYLRLGDLDLAGANFDIADAHLARALPPGHPDRLRAAASRASLNVARGAYDVALTRVVDVLETQRRTLGQTHLDTLNSQVLLGSVLFRLDRWPQAEASLVQALSVLETSHPDVWRPQSQALTLLAKVHLAQRRPNDARLVLDRLLVLQRRFLGARHPDVIETLTEQAAVLRQLEQVDDALLTAKSALRLARDVYGANSPEVARMASGLGRSHMRARRYQQAQELFEEALAGLTAQLGVDHTSTIDARSNVATALSANGQHAAAEQLYRQVAQDFERLLGPRHTNTIRALKNLTHPLRNQGKDAAAAAVVAQLTDIARLFVNDELADPIVVSDMAEYLLTCEPKTLRDPETALTMAQFAVTKTAGQRGEPLMTLALALRQHNRRDEAIEALERAARLPDMLHIHALPRYLATLYLEIGDIDRGVSFFKAHLARRQAARADDDWLIGMALHEYGRFFVNADRGADAVPVLRRAIDQYLRTRTDDDALVFRSRAALGAAQMQVGDYPHAERNLLDGFEGVRLDRRVTSDVKREIVGWLAELYERQARDAQRDHWQSVLAVRQREPLFSVWE